MTTRRARVNAKALDAFMTTKLQIDAMLECLKTQSADHLETSREEINWGDVGTLNHYASLVHQITGAAFKGANMPLDPAQRDQIEQDALTAEWQAERLAACDGAIALLREIADLERNDEGDVILGAAENGRNDLLSRVATFLATHDQ